MPTRRRPERSSRAQPPRAAGARRPTRVTVTRLTVILLGGVMLGLGVSVTQAKPSAATGAAEMVTFQRFGAHGCASSPDLSWLMITVGDWLTVVNRTGLDATVEAGPRRISTRDGEGVAVKLAIGVHRVRLVPLCAIWAAAVPVIVVVQPASSLSPEAARPGDYLPAPPASHPTEPAAAAVPAGDPRGPGRTAGESAGAAGRPTGGRAGVRLLVSPIPDGSRTRLLALVAVVCVLGVTAAIIRAIVAQRTSNPMRG